MTDTKISYVLFDAAGTLIHKPSLWHAVLSTLERHGIELAANELMAKHKIVSECTPFPDRTSKAFYGKFNSELLYALGVMPTPELLDEIFSACSYLPWEKIEDAEIISDITQPIGILSNFNATLGELIEGFWPGRFRDLLVSEVLGVAKPHVEFFEKAVEAIGCDAGKILYVGDSPKLDLHPALSVGLRVRLIDREGHYPSSPYRLDSLRDLTQLLSP